MKVDHIAFYPISIDDRHNFRGTLHVYLPHIDFDIRGIYCVVKKNVPWIDLPSCIGYDEGKKVKYPIVNFADAKKNRALITGIRANLMQFIEEEMKID